MTDALADPSPLFECDSAYITVHALGPVYGIAGIRPGDLVDELGLHDNDRLVSVNGMSLDSKDDLIQAFGWLRATGETEFSLIIEPHGSSPYTLSYELIP